MLLRDAAAELKGALIGERLWAAYGGLPATRPPTVHPLLFDPLATSLFHVVGFAWIAIVAFAGPSRVSGFVRRWFLASRADAAGG